MNGKFSQHHLLEELPFTIAYSWHLQTQSSDHLSRGLMSGLLVCSRGLTFTSFVIHPSGRLLKHYLYQFAFWMNKNFDFFFFFFGLKACMGLVPNQGSTCAPALAAPESWPLEPPGGSDFPSFNLLNLAKPGRVESKVMLTVVVILRSLYAVHSWFHHHFPLTEPECLITIPQVFNY